MSFRIVKHLCGHEARYRVKGVRMVVEHHIHELEQSPCTPCAEQGSVLRRHIYLGRGARVISLPEQRVAPEITSSTAGHNSASHGKKV